MYGHILYIIIYWLVSEIATCDFFVSFFDSYFLKLRNALGNEKTVKFFFIFYFFLYSFYI